MNDSTKRIHSLDLLKGIAIFLVVMGHVLTMCIRDIDAAFLFKFIGETHMPIFFFISGFLVYKHGFATPAMGKRFVQLIVPFVTMSALWVLYFPHSRLESPLPTTLPDLYADPWKGGYWFTLCLFELMTIYWVLSFALSRLGNVVARVALVVAVYVGLFLLNLYAPSALLGSDFVVTFYPIFFVGVAARRSQDVFARLQQSPIATTAAIIAGALTFYVVVWNWEFNLPELSVTLLRSVFQMCLLLTAFALVEPWSRREYAPEQTPSLAARTFALLGRESLPIYLCHYFFLFPLGYMRPALQAVGLGLVPLAVVSAITAAAITAVTLIAVRIIKTSRPLALLMLGQPWKSNH